MLNNNSSIFSKQVLSLFLVLVTITTTVYFQSLNNQFTNWDDTDYITHNLDIRTLQGDSIAYSLNNTFTSFVMGNYHPITMLVYSMEYTAFELSPKPYHVIHLIIHLLNVLLVMYFVMLLCKQNITAFVTALLFGIHPMHVESVAWLSELKDVLYTLFTLASMCLYMIYTSSEKKRYLFYMLAIVMFVLATLSKAMAVFLPLALILIDYYKVKNITIKSLFDKVPFLLISTGFGLLAIKAQMTFNAVQKIESYNFFERILFSCYGVLMYIWKLIVPTNLSCNYVYPLKVDGLFPVEVYLSLLVIIAIGYLLFKYREKLHNIVFGFGFFIVSIALVLQILPVGGAIIAERYTYIPYIGLFFIVGVFINNIYEDALPKLKQYKTVLLGLFAIIVLTYSYQANERTKVWKDSITLWSEFEQNYDSIPSWISTNLRISYRDKAKELLLSGEYKSAEAHYTNYIIRRADNPLMYYERGLCYFNLKMYTKAIADYNSAIALKGDYFAAYYNKGITYNDLGDFNAAISAYSNALKYNKTYVDAYYNRAGAYFMTQQLPLALQDVLKAKDLGYNVDPRFIDAIKAGIK